MKSECKTMHNDAFLLDVSRARVTRQSQDLFKKEKIKKKIKTSRYEKDDGNGIENKGMNCFMVTI